MAEGEGFEPAVWFTRNASQARRQAFLYCFAFRHGHLHNFFTTVMRCRRNSFTGLEFSRIAEGACSSTNPSAAALIGFLTKSIRFLTDKLLRKSYTVVADLKNAH
jgi:hypothetical protein